jgi:hypothetical protein
MAKQVLSTLQEDFEAIGLAPKSPDDSGGEDLDEVKRVKTKKMSSAEKAKERQRYKSRKSRLRLVAPRGRSRARLARGACASTPVLVRSPTS